MARLFPGPLPKAVAWGMALVLVGLALDLAYHLVSAHPSLTAPCCGAGFFGHIVTLAGMALALSGLVRVALVTRAPRSSDRKEA